jgi:hypothetical protein
MAPFSLRWLRSTLLGGDQEPYAQALLRLSLDLTQVLGCYRVQEPASADSDFGSTGLAFVETVLTMPNPTMHYMVGIANKNGVYYALNRQTFSGMQVPPEWSVQVAIGVESGLPGSLAISPSAYDNTTGTLYVAGGLTPDQQCKGSLQVYNVNAVPVTQSTIGPPPLLWTNLPGDRVCFKDGPVVGAVTAIPELVVVGEGP